MKTISSQQSFTYQLLLIVQRLLTLTKVLLVASLSVYFMSMTLLAQTPALELETPASENSCALNHKIAVGLGRTLPLRTPPGMSLGIGISQKLIGFKENSLYTSIEWNFSRQNKEYIQESPELLYVHKNYQIMSFSIPVIYRQALGSSRQSFMEGGLYGEYILPVRTDGVAIYQTVGDWWSLPAPPVTSRIREKEEMEKWNWGIHFALGRTLKIGTQTFQLKWMVRGGFRRLDSSNDRLYHSYSQVNIGWNFR